MKTIIIACLSRNGVIGRRERECPNVSEHVSGTCRACRRLGILLATRVTHPEHEAYVEETTRGHAVVMGRKTWEERGARPCTPFVVSTTMYDLEDIPPDGTVACRMETAIACVSEDGFAEVFILGGAQLFAAALPLADDLHLTLIDRDEDGDVVFPGGEIWANSDAVAAAHLGMGSDPSPWWFELAESRPGADPLVTFTVWRRA